MINCSLLRTTVSLIPKLSLCFVVLSFAFELTSLFCFVFSYSVFNVLSDLGAQETNPIPLKSLLFKFLFRVWFGVLFVITSFLTQKVYPSLVLQSSTGRFPLPTSSILSLQNLLSTSIFLKFYISLHCMFREFQSSLDIAIFIFRPIV